MQQLTGERAAFTAVGDDDQAIYAWRGAVADNLHQLREDYPHLHVVKLEQNYRSTVRILNAANSLIANNPKLFEKKPVERPRPGRPDPGDADAGRRARGGIRGDAPAVAQVPAPHRFADYAILYRGNHQARVFEQQLRNEKMPYQLSGGQSFFDRAEIKDMIAYLRLIANSDDDPAFIRAVTTPKRGIGTSTLEKLGSYAATRHISLFEAAFSAGRVAQSAQRHRRRCLNSATSSTASRNGRPANRQARS